MPSTETSTPTTSAMPSTITLDVPQRDGTLRRFIAVTAPISRNRLMIDLPFVSKAALDQRRASAATTSSRCTRHAGNAPLNAATSTAIRAPMPNTFQGNAMPSAWISL